MRGSWLTGGCGYGAPRRIGRVDAALPVHLVEALGRRVVRLQVLVGDGPGRRDATPVLELAEVFPAQAEERGTVELGVAAHVVVRVRMELRAGGIAPDLLRVVLSLEVHRASAPVVLLARYVLPSLEDQDALAGGGERPGQRAAARAGADDRDVVACRHR